MLKSIKMLKEEHEVILKALNILNTIEVKDDTIDDIKSIIRFIKNFVDDCHHVKEEKALFYFLEQKGLAGGPIHVMVYEHNKLRDLIAQIETRYKEYDELRKSLDSLISLLAEHIDKENTVLFPMTENLITIEEDNLIYEEFERIEENFGLERHKEYVNLVNSLYTKYNKTSL
ncbi:hemerythrin domain-containing protein [Sulfolobus tengchongensis]|uniref:Hemerythrin domain-containing protein n=1 Tax=Sulfolobus tengchongensis TaxID=207809 RepID=A0AAX4KZL5_9CREN